ncbi:MAG: DNA helicase II, partial [Halomonadaceae bacterium]
PVTAARGGLSQNLRQQSVEGDDDLDLPSLHIGQAVEHPVFGEGVILNAEGEGARARVQVSFEHEGAKWLVLGFAKLIPL